MSSPLDPAASARVHADLAALRTDVDGLRRELAALAAEQVGLRAQLERSEAARADLFAQARHVVGLLAESRREVWALQGEPRR